MSLNFVKIDFNKYISKCLLEKLFIDGRVVSIMTEQILKSEYGMDGTSEVRFISEKSGVSFLPSKQKGFGREEDILEFKSRGKMFKHYWLIYRLPMSFSVVVFRINSKDILKTEGKLSFKDTIEFIKNHNNGAYQWLV